MNSNYLSGNDLYPKSVVAAMTYLFHFSDGENKNGISYAQYADNRTCYRCGEKGHAETPDCQKNKMNAYQTEEEKTLDLPNAGYAMSSKN